jgi:hypothetical protein
MFHVELETTHETSLFMVPRLLNLAMNVNIDTVYFGKSVLTDLHGEVEIRDEHLRLNQFRVRNFAGEMDLSLAYRASSLSEAQVWMEINIENTEIQDLLKLADGIGLDTLVPITQSLEGLVTCKLTVSAILDSAMDVNLEKTIANGNLHGQNLVLLDGETFTEIARMLRFRNRDRNLIDSLSVNLSVNNGIIEIYPFKLTMDRYVLAVGGEQDLDMNFNYHITVLRSPIPFTMGINISGTPERMNRPRLVSPRFRDMNTPATSVHMNRTINAQREFQRILDHQLNQIIGEPQN